ncbi:uncharacterized protein LOC110344473 isoform X4 [Heterocephalus glaber]|uniref:Uncharacterized protein LOC110344473 isoform X4 n=1 Tax=Heterocephalus glaber TaxID=10181 RepID=A0AAX6RG10_HETGA|nr:uncharacterized protein LOC110344473 isoform X4 [Heterocephalus glaber]
MPSSVSPWAATGEERTLGTAEKQSPGDPSPRPGRAVFLAGFRGVLSQVRKGEGCQRPCPPEGPAGCVRGERRQPVRRKGTPNRPVPPKAGQSSSSADPAGSFLYNRGPRRQAAARTGPRPAVDRRPEARCRLGAWSSELGAPRKCTSDLQYGTRGGPLAGMRVPEE